MELFYVLVAVNGIAVIVAFDVVRDHPFDVRLFCIGGWVASLILAFANWL